MPASVLEIESAQGIALLYKESCVFVTHTEDGAKHKRTVFLADIICVELCGCELAVGNACGTFGFAFDSEDDASRFEQALVSCVTDVKHGTNTAKTSAEDKIRIGEDEFAAALFGDGMYDAPASSDESPADFLARLYDADADEIIRVLQNGREKFTVEELERIEAALVMKMEM